MLLLNWVTMFFVTWNSISCDDDFNELFIDDKNEYFYSTGMAINFIIKNISAVDDIRIVATDLFFIHNYTTLATTLRRVPLTLLNVGRC